MKIDDLTNNKLIPEEPIFEALRFGQKEQGIVISAANLFTIGIEYEFTVNDGIPAIDANMMPNRREKTKVEYALQYARDQLWMWASDITTIESDFTVPNGAELVTRPMDLRSSLKMMKDVFEFIDEIGGTDRSTGLHINVSMNGFNPSNFNPIKAAVLLDMTHKSSDSKFPARFLVEDIANELADDEYLVGLARVHKNGGARELIRRFESVIRRAAVKGSNINMDAFFDRNVRQSERRIEWRYIGGDNYHKRRMEIVNEVLNICYVMLAGASGSMEKEYHQAIVRMLNRAADKRQRGRTFSDYLRAIDRVL